MPAVRHGKAGLFHLPILRRKAFTDGIFVLTAGMARVETQHKVKTHANTFTKQNEIEVIKSDLRARGRSLNTNRVRRHVITRDIHKHRVDMKLRARGRGLDTIKVKGQTY